MTEREREEFAKKGNLQIITEKQSEIERQTEKKKESKRKSEEERKGKKHRQTDTHQQKTGSETAKKGDLQRVADKRERNRKTKSK